MIVKGIIALYLHRKIKSDDAEVKSLFKRVLKEARLPTALLGTGGDGEIANGLRDTLDWLVSLSDDIDVSSEDLIARIKLNTGIENHYTDIVGSAIQTSEDEDDIKNRIRLNVSEIKTELNNQKLKSLLSQANRTAGKNEDYLDKEQFIKDLLGELDEIKSGFNPDGPVTDDKFNSDSDDNSLEEFFSKAKELVSGEGVLKSGLVGLNRALGVGGFPRGSYTNFGALTHNYKSGILLDLFRQVPMHNKPFMLYPEKKLKPLILRVSFENRIEQDLPKLYKDLFGQEYKKGVKDDEINPKEAAAYVKERLMRHGYHFAMEFFSPNDFTVDDLIGLLEKYEADGYEIHLLSLDYLELIAKNDKSVREDIAITNGIERLRGHCFPRGIAVVSAHQLSTEAQELARQGSSNLAKRVSEGGWYMNCKSLHTKLDIEFTMHKHVSGDNAYLTFARGKNRYSSDTPIRHKTFAYKFQDVGAIHDDIEDENPKMIYDMYSLGTDDRAQENNGGGNSSDKTSDDEW